MNANKINYPLREAGLNQTKLAKILGKPRSYVTEVITGHRRTTEIQEDIARAIGLPVIEIRVTTLAGSKEVWGLRVDIEEAVVSKSMAVGLDAVLYES